MQTTATLHITLNDGKTRFIAYGGDPRGGCPVHKAVSSWPGWRRVGSSDSTSTFSGPLTVLSALSLAATTIGVTWDPDAQAASTNRYLAFEKARRFLDGSLAYGELFFPIEAAHKPMPHQWAAIGAILAMDSRVLLADDMGLGKSATALWAIHESGTPRTLIVCPASVKYNWQREVEKTIGEECIVIGGSSNVREAQLGGFGNDGFPNFLVINYDLLIHLTEMQQQNLAKWVDGQAVILDECHYLKNSTSKRTTRVRELFCPPVGGAHIRLGLSGTPVRNTIEDLYSQIQLIRPGTFTSLYSFRHRYCVISNMLITQRGRQRSIPLVRGAKNQRELNQILNTLQIRRKKGDVLDLPPKIKTFPTLELDPYTSKVYAAMRDFALIELGKLDGGVNIFNPKAKTAADAAAKCEQIAQGCLSIPGAETLLPKISKILTKHAVVAPGKPTWVIFPESPKLVWAKEQIKTVLGQGGQPIIVSRFNAPLAWLHEQHEGSSFLWGGLESVERQRIIDAFQAGKSRVLFIQIRIAEGMNLTASQDVFLLGRDWSPAINVQAEDRTHRIGQTGTVNIQIPIVRKTIEMRMDKALISKEAQAEGALCFQTVQQLMEALA